MKHKLLSLLILSLTATLAACGGFSIPDDESNTESNGADLSESESGSDGSDSQPGDAYQVSESWWNENILQMGYFDATHNFTAQASVMDDGVTMRMLYENDYGKYHLRVDGQEGTEMYLESDGNGQFYVYYLDDNGSWAKTPKAIAGYTGATFAQDLILPLPYDLLTYNPQTHAYELPDFAMDGQTLSNVSVKFEKQQLIAISYAGSSVDDEDGSVHTFSVNANFVNHGTTKVTFPTVGGQGEIHDENPFINKMIVFSYMETTSVDNERWESMFQNSFMNLFAEGNFEFIYLNQGKPSAFLGTYLVSEKLDAATLYVTKRYDGVSNMYIEDNLTYYLRLVEGDDGTVYYQYDTQLGSSDRGSLFFVDSGVAPTPYDLPDDPNAGGGEEDKQYKVTEAVWNKWFFKQEHLSSTFNATIQAVSPDGQKVIEIDQRKIHLTMVDAQGKTTQTFYEYKGNDKYDSYYYNETKAQWIKQEAELGANWFDLDLGLLPLPFEKVSYNEFQKYYSCSYFKYTPDPEYPTYYEEYQNIHVAFLEEKLQKIEYKYLGSQLTFTYSKYNNTTVTLPSTGGGTVTPDNYNELLRNSVYDYIGLVNAADLTGAEAIGTTFTGSYISFFNDDTFEYVRFKDINQAGTVVDSEVAIIGTFKVVDGKDASYKVVGLTATMMISNGVTEEVDNETMTIRYYIEDNQLKMPLDNNGNYNGPCALFSHTNKTPEHYEYTGPVVPPQPQSNWPLEEIQRGLTSIGLANETIPELQNIASGTVRTTEKSVVITCSFADEVTAASAFAGYASVLMNAEFSPVYSSFSDEDDTSYTFTSKSGEMALTFTYAGGTSGTITAEPASKFPSEEVAAYLSSKGWTDKLPDLLLSLDATCQFDSTDKYLLFTVSSGSEDAAIREIKSILARNSFVNKQFLGSNGVEEHYVSPNNQYVVYTKNGGNGLVLVCFFSTDEMTPLLDNYPADVIATQTPNYITDELPDLSYRGAKYMVLAEDNEVYILYVTSNGVTSDAVKQSIVQTLTRAGFVSLDSDPDYYSMHNQIIVSFGEEDGYLVVHISFSEENNEYTCTYDIAFDNDYDPFKDDAQVYAWVWGGNYGDGDWVEVQKEEGEDGTVRYFVEVDNTATNMIIVRFARDADIYWPSEEDAETVIWNKSHPDNDAGISLPGTLVATITVHLGNYQGL